MLRLSLRVTTSVRHTLESPFRRLYSIDYHTPDYDTRELTLDQQLLQQELQGPLIPHLKDRGLISQCSDEKDLSEIISKRSIKLYCGADPTAESLHIGNLLPLLILLHFYIRGHSVVGIVGGATGAVGDPSGRDTERQIIADQIRENNLRRIKKQIEVFFQNGANYATFNSTKTVISAGELSVQNNADWWSGIGFLDFLASYGRFIRVSQMLARDSVKARLESEAGIGFNEFSYQILQAYDFWHLFSNQKVEVQVGGNDQWGNITAGMDLISRIQPETGKEDDLNVFGITAPLLTTSTGAKFGKSAGNAVFISTKHTPAFELYQYFVRQPDSEVPRLLKIFTLIPLQQIETIMAEHNRDPAERYAQRVLAAEVTDLIHGVGASKDAKIVTSLLYPRPENPYPDVPTERLITAFKGAGILTTLKKEQVFGKPVSQIVSTLHNVSKNEARKLVKSGAVYLGWDRTRVEESDSVLITDDVLLGGELLVLRVGKGKYYVTNFE